MANVNARSPSIEYTGTTAGIQVSNIGLYRLDYYADAYGSMSIDEQNAAGTYVANAAMSFSAETHKVVRLRPGNIIRVTITGGTNPIVTLTELPRGI